METEGWLYCTKAVDPRLYEANPPIAHFSGAVQAGLQAHVQ